MNNADEVRGARAVIATTAAFVGALVFGGAKTPPDAPDPIEHPPPPIQAPTKQQPATVEPSCEIVDYGPYVAVSERHRYRDEGSVTGHRFATRVVEFRDRTNAIAMRLGEAFGVRYRADRIPSGTTVTHRIVYPTPLRGFKDWRHDIENVSPGDVSHIGYYFDHDYEMVPGRWEFQILVDGKEACGLAFTVK